MNCPKGLIVVVGALLLLHTGCAGPGRTPAPPAPQPAALAPDIVTLVESFVRKVVAGDDEGAFACLDIRSLVNYGRPQWELYRSLSPQEQERYRRDFREGFYAFLFRDLPAAQATWRVEAPDPGSPLVEVTGRPGKVLRLVVQQTPAGLKIVMIERG